MTVGPMGRTTKGSKDQWAVVPMGRRTNGLYVQLPIRSIVRQCFLKHPRARCHPIVVPKVSCARRPWLIVSVNLGYSFNVHA